MFFPSNIHDIDQNFKPAFVNDEGIARLPKSLVLIKQRVDDRIGAAVGREW